MREPVVVLPAPLADSLCGRVGGLRDALVGARTDVAVVTTITMLAAALRLWRIGSVPRGLHGDEAWTGIDAQRVLHEGWIGPYLTSALGQPIGPVYATAAFFSVLPDTTTTLRLSMALFGVATIPLAYLAFALMFNRTVAAFATLILATMTWHLHLSRLGFMVTTWPFIEMAILLALWQAVRRHNMPLFLLAGALAGAGIYTYNAYLLFLPVTAVALVAAVWPWRSDGWHWRASVAAIALVVLGAVIVALPMLRYIDEHTYEYRYHQRAVSVTNSDAWEDAAWPGRADLIWDRGIEWGRALVRGDRTDLGDGLASDGHPVVHPLIAALAIAGLGVAAWNGRRAEYLVLIAAAAILPWGALLTVLDGLFRRTFGLAPFVAVLAALPLAWLWEQALRSRSAVRYAAAAGILLAPLYVGVVSARQYFGPVQDDPYVRFVFPYQIDAASEYMATLPEETLIYVYSERWKSNYETRRFLAPDARAVDRSFEFRPPNASPELDFSLEPGRPAAFVFLGTYLDRAGEVAGRYPGGRMIEESRDGEVLFRAYELPGD